MRTRPPSERRGGSRGRASSVPARSRMTVARQPAAAPLLRSSQGELVAALRGSREALAAVEGQLAALLATLRDPGATPDAAAADRLHGATRRAGSAMAMLSAAAVASSR